MPTDPRNRPDDPERPDRRAGPEPSDPGGTGTRSAVGVSAVALLGVVCCAAPALLTAGALGVIGSWLAEPWLLTAAAVTLAAALGWALRRRTSHRD